MSGRVRRVSSHRRLALSQGWALCSTPARQFSDPSQLAELNASAWVEAPVVAPAAAVLAATGRWSLDGAARRFDAEDWWYRLQFAAPADAASASRLVLGLDGLATIADVWLNGKPVLHSENMFIAHRVNASSSLAAQNNELVICFRSLDDQLTKRRPRPRWRAPMVEHQQMRWFRTTLLGRTPGWSPPAAVVGPWRDVWLESRRDIEVGALHLQANVQGTTGLVEVACEIEEFGGSTVRAAVLNLRRGGRVIETPLRRIDHGPSYKASMTVEGVDLWWPHTHGEPALYDAQLQLTLSDEPEPVEVDLGPVGFRTLTLDARDGRFALAINGVEIFCRGACWTPTDIVRLRADPEAYARTLAEVVQSGMNMLRVGGMMVYEDDAFYDACDRLGILVWQDFMFANMDYPEGDAAFMASVEVEVTQVLERLQARPCLALLCGNGEVEQQAAMWGTSREAWQPQLFHGHLPDLARRLCPGVPYWPSSAHGGSIPHQIDQGSTSYFGVGAYLRPLDDARRSGLRFASECLAFANIPEDSALARMPGGLSIKVHHPTWKARSPRDLGAGWDFDDVRDFYLAKSFGVDPLMLRYSNHDHYLRLGRIVTGRVMAAALTEWRRADSTCRGALIWFLRDLWAGAGWGVLDDAGGRKACWHHVKRACQPVAVGLTDEGGNGLYIHLANDPGSALSATLEVAMYRIDGVCLTKATRALEMAPRSAQTLSAGALFETAHDMSAAFRFSDSEYATVVASLCDADGRLLSQAFHLQEGPSAKLALDIGLSATARALEGGQFELAVRSRQFALAVYFDVPGFSAEEEYFDLAPQYERRIVFSPLGAAKEGRPGGRVMATNTKQNTNIEWQP